MTTLYSKIMGDLEEKHEKQKIEVVNRFPLLTSVPDNVMLGSFSWYYMQQKRKEILSPFALHFPSVTTTPSEIARAYIAAKYEKVRALREQIEIFKQPIAAPLYVQPHSYESAYYIDIKSAYWQILQVVGWDADYNPGKWLGKGKPMDDFPFAEIKLSRNCLITCGLPSEASFWNGAGRRFERVKTFNKQINLGIWKLVMDVLHCVAWDCIAAGAIYAHTDGYICSSERAMAVEDAISEWGLTASVKLHGAAHVYGVGSYQIGKTATKNPHINSHPYDGLILPEYNKWLKKRFKAHAERTKFLWQNLNWERSPSELLTLSSPAEKSLMLSLSVKAASETPVSRISSDGVIVDTLSSLT